MDATQPANGCGLTFDLDSGEFHDLVIRCGGKEWKAHRVIVSAASTFFHKACQDTFKEGLERLIGLKDDDPGYIHEMLRFIYTGTFDVSAFTFGLLADIGIYALADKYDVKGLKEHAAAKFHTAMASFPDGENVKAPEITAIVDAIYSTTPASDRGLRDIIAPFIFKHKMGLRAHEEFMALFRQDGDLATEVLELWAGMKKEANTSTAAVTREFPRCPRCSRRVCQCKI